MGSFRRVGAFWEPSNLSLSQTALGSGRRPQEIMND
jgi:hypothetical protein